MNQVYIIGNGFDLAHNLDTKYYDFILWYVRSAYETYKSGNTYDDGAMKLTKRNGYSNYPSNDIQKVELLT
jgi:hypothetical protein